LGVSTLVTFLGSVGLLNFGGSLLLFLSFTFNLVAGELLPEIFELSVVFLNVVGVVDY
jgi:hypothetical protein